MNDSEFWICPTCFYTSEQPDPGHPHIMICCKPGMRDDKCRRPPMDSRGRWMSRAPLWFFRALGRRWPDIGSEDDVI